MGGMDVERVEVLSIRKVLYEFWIGYGKCSPPMGLSTIRRVVHNAIGPAAPREGQEQAVFCPCHEGAGP